MAAEIPLSYYGGKRSATLGVFMRSVNTRSGAAPHRSAVILSGAKVSRMQLTLTSMCGQQARGRFLPLLGMTAEWTLEVGR
jgi:hypothetical protein